MHALSISVLLGLALTTYGFPETQIVGGKDAPEGMFKYQVSLRRNGNHFCGGSIISSRVILTAAHCVAGLNNIKAVTVHAGTNQLNKPGNVYQVSRIARHSGYSSTLLVNDIALILVTKDITFNNRVGPIKLNDKNVSLEGSSCTLSGWGTLQAGGRPPNNMQYISLRIESQAECKKAHWRVKETHICTYTKRGEGACNGDSGGPLAVNGVQVGIVSFGQPCGVGKPDVYTRVSSFIPWIQQNSRRLVRDEATDAVFIY